MKEQIVVTASQPVTDTQWQAILERDRNADGRFVYGVITTGIFCRPSCPARRPNVEKPNFSNKSIKS